jgi:hypothetical protein
VSNSSGTEPAALECNLRQGLTGGRLKSRTDALYQARQLLVRHSTLRAEGTERHVTNARVQSGDHIFLGGSEADKDRTGRGEPELNFGGGAPQEGESRINPLHGCIMHVSGTRRGDPSTPGIHRTLCRLALGRRAEVLAV